MFNHSESKHLNQEDSIQKVWISGMFSCALNSIYRLLRNGWNIWFVSLRICHLHNSTRLEIGIIRFYKILLPGRLFDDAAGTILFFCE